MSFTPSNRRWVWVPALVAGVVLVGALALAVLAAPGPAYDVRGEVAVPYDAGTVKEVRVLDSVTLYVDGVRRPGPAMLGGMALIVLGTAAFVTAVALSLAGAGRRLRTFYLVIAAGLGYAGLDKLFAIHQSVGHNLQFLADVPGVERPDDLLLALYLVPIVAVAYVFRDLFLSHGWAARALGAGLGLFALSASFDLASLTAAETLAELLSGICISAGICTLMYAHLRSHLRPPDHVLDHLTAVEEGEPRVRRFPRRDRAAAPPRQLPEGRH